MISSCMLFREIRSLAHRVSVYASAGGGIRQISSAAAEVPQELQYLKFDPPRLSSGKKSVAPMVVLHGLLGSKQNNRSVCKFVLWCVLV